MSSDACAPLGGRRGGRSGGGSGGSGGGSGGGSCGGSSSRKKAKPDASAAPPAFKDGLPPAKMLYEKLMRDVSQAMDDRGTSQSELCRSLSLSPVSMSLWRRNKPLPVRTRDLYSAALELWLADPSFELSDPKLTNTAPNSVRRRPLHTSRRFLRPPSPVATRIYHAPAMCLPCT